MGVTDCRCFSAIDSRMCMSIERIVGTCCCISRVSSSRRDVVMRSLRGDPNSSEVVSRNVSPRSMVSGLRSIWVRKEEGGEIMSSKRTSGMKSKVHFWLFIGAILS